MNDALSHAVLAQAFFEARSTSKFTEQSVSEETLTALYDLAKWGPTAFNCQPMRLVFVRSAAGKAKLAEALMPANVAKTLAAPVTAIVALDTQFYEQLPSQFPANPAARDLFANNPALAQEAGMRNGSLQGGYLMIAARLLGLACGPMSGFNPAKLNEAFFADGRWKANFLCNLGYGDAAGNHPRGPRLGIAQAVRFE